MILQIESIYFTKLEAIGIVSSGIYQGLKLVNVGDGNFFSTAHLILKRQRKAYIIFK